nr:MAG TPA: hypothetical protein [Caudoviricetes sp.]
MTLIRQLRILINAERHEHLLISKVEINRLS